MMVKSHHHTQWKLGLRKPYHICRNLRTPPNLLIMNLAVSDFFMLVKMPLFVYNSFLQGPALGKIGCDIYGFLGGLTGTASILTLAAVASDRYRVISSPLNLDRKTTKSRALLIIVAIWVYSFFFASLPLFGIGRYVPEGYLTSCSFDYLAQDVPTRIFIFTFFVAAWVVPFTIIMVCYTAIVRAVSVNNRFIAACEDQHGEQGKVRADGQRTAELHITRTVFSLIILWLASWTPYAMVALLGIAGRRDLITPLLSMIPALFAKTSAVVNPFLYCLNHPKIKRELFMRFQRFFASASHSNSGSCRLQRKGADVPSLYSMASFNASISLPQLMIENQFEDVENVRDKVEAEKNNSDYCSKPLTPISSHYENLSLTRVESSVLKFPPSNDEFVFTTVKKLQRVRSLPSLP